jgi:hypothetical protein
MGIKVPLTEGLKKMGITQSMLDNLISMGSAASVSSGGYSGSYKSDDESDEDVVNFTPITKDDSVTSKPKTVTDPKQPTMGGRYAVSGDENSNDSNGDKVSLPSYKEIVALMKKAGVPESRIKAFKTINQWSMHPNGNTYEDYVARYLEDLGLV